MNINQSRFEKVVAAAKAKAAGHPEWLRAIEKAAAAILSGKMIVTPLAHGALVTTEGGTYKANGRCNCAARTPWCYHLAGARLMELYEAVPACMGPDNGAAQCETAPPHITRSVERDVITRRRVKVVRCDGWAI